MNLSKQEFLNCGDSAKYIQDKSKLRAELEQQVAEFLAEGGMVQALPKGFSGEFNKAKSGLIQISSVIAGSIAEAKSNTPRAAKLRAERAKTYYDKQKAKRELIKQEAKRIREALQSEQKTFFKKFDAKANHGDLKLLAKLSGVSMTTIHSAMQGLTVLKKQNWELVKKAIQEFDFTVNQATPRRRRVNKLPYGEKRTSRLAYMSQYQNERKLSAITQKYCGSAAV